MSTDDGRERAVRLDADDPLAEFAKRFVVPDPDLIYLDGNSLGRLPASTPGRLDRAVRDEWGDTLIRSWPTWLRLAHDVGDLIGTRVLSARPGEVLVSDTTTVNLYKLASAALDARPDRRVIVTDDDNFPTDRYVLAGLAQQRGLVLRMVHSDIDEGISTDSLRAALDDDVALVSLSHVAYRSGALTDMVGVSRLVREHGALLLWDLCHSVGAVPVPLAEAEADLAVGCTYKYLNAGPGSPAFLYVRRDLQDTLTSPIWGWLGNTDPFTMGPAYQPAPGLDRFLTGTPAILQTYAVGEGAAVLAEAGMDALRAKGVALTSYLIELADRWLAPLGFELASPRDPARRGSHVCLAHPDAAALTEALINAGVVPDYRSPDRIRLGLAPLTTSYTDVWDALSRLRDLAQAG